MGFMRYSRDKTLAKIAEMMIEGKTKDYIAPLLFRTHKPGESDEDPELNARARRAISIMMKDPKYADIHRAALIEMAAPKFDKALATKEALLDNDNAWLRNNAASDIIALYKPYVLGDEEKALTIKFEGMPEIGTPDGDD